MLKMWSSPHAACILLLAERVAGTENLTYILGRKKVLIFIHAHKSVVLG